MAAHPDGLTGDPPRHAGSIQVRQDVLAAVAAHAREEAPHECCGLLVGTRALVDEAVRTRNLDPRPSRYRIDPREHVRLIRTLRGTTRSIVGAYHSHVRSPAIPSQSDVAEAFYPEFLYVIVSLATPDEPVVRGFSIASGNVRPVALVPVP
jgi:[CysO sulfur-carrier protein]-S-L-cysteine hydrolase